MWHEIRCDKNLPGCLSERNDGPKGFDRAQVLKEARKRGWITTRANFACYPRCHKSPLKAALETIMAPGFGATEYDL